MFKNLKIAAKLAIGFGVIIAMAVIMATANYWSYSDIRTSAGHTQKDLYPILTAANTMIEDAIQVQQWTTDISATRGLNGLNDGIEKANEYANDFRAKLTQLIQRDSEHADQLKTMRQPFEEFYKTAVKMANAYIKDGPAGGNLIMGELDQASEKLQGMVREYYITVETQFRTGLADIAKTTTYATSLSNVLALLMLVVGLAVAWLIARGISRPVMVALAATEDVNRQFNDLERVIETIAGNDLTVKIENTASVVHLTDYNLS